MSFFFKPPRGNIALHTIKHCVHQRIQYLMSIVNGDDTYEPEKPEYLITASSMDRAAHYMLRLLSISSYLIRDFFVRAETKLFSARLKRLRPEEILIHLRSATRHVSESINCSGKPTEFQLHMKSILQKIALKPVVDHILSEDHSSACEKFSITAPFTMCLALVQKRIVPLKDGIAKVPCGLWDVFLCELFEMHIVDGMEHIVNSGCFEEAFNDLRMKQLQKELQQELACSSVKISPGVLKACDVDAESALFPVCMVHLHQVLKSRHRLSHEWRRQYTLFLKDIGMPIGEAITFWSQEYSKPKQGGCGGCDHSWQKDAKRFHYSIRHMYGLEGGRYHYTVGRCKALQDASLQPTSEGGCPFKHFDEEKLISYFPPEVVRNVSVMKTILHLKEINPTKACRALLFAVSNEEPLKNGFGSQETVYTLGFCKPTQYYFCLKKT